MQQPLSLNVAALNAGCRVKGSVTIHLADDPAQQAAAQARQIRYYRQCAIAAFPGNPAHGLALVPLFYRHGRAGAPGAPARPDRQRGPARPPGADHHISTATSSACCAGGGRFYAPSSARSSPCHFTSDIAKKAAEPFFKDH
jgi:hypothetical protein